LFSAKPQTRAMHEAMVTDPSMMADMMKKNLTGMVPQASGRAYRYMMRTGGVPPAATEPGALRLGAAWLAARGDSGLRLALRGELCAVPDGQGLAAATC
jgi:hypothetical protein